MKLSLIADTRKPAEFAGSCFYLVHSNTDAMSVGDVISVDCHKDIHASVVHIWVTFSPHTRHVPVNETAYGHKHIIELDKDIGRVTVDQTIRCRIVGR